MHRLFSGKMANLVLHFIGFFVFLGFTNVAFSEAIDKSLTVVSVPDYPYLAVSDDGSVSGFVPDLLDLLGINYTLNLANRYGFLYANGSWGGMMGELVEGRADVIGPLTISKSRSEVVDFVSPIQTAVPAIVMKKPTTETSLAERLTRLLEPMESSVWLMSFLALLVTGTVLYIFAHFNPYEWRRMYKDREATVREAESFTCLNSFWFVISTLMWQGYVRAPRSVGARILVTSWWAFVVIFLISYTASLTNYLRTGVDKPAISSISSFKDLLETDQVKVGVIPNGATEHFFRDSTSEEYRKLYQRIVKDRTNETDFKSSSDMIKYVRDQEYSNYAAILESPYAKYVTHQEPCNLYMIKDDYNLRTISFAVQKGNDLQRQLSQAILHHHENGDIHKLENKWFKPKCESSIFRPNANQEIRISAFSPLNLGTFSAALCILLIGIILGGLVTLIEVCIYKWAESRSDEDEDEMGPVKVPIGDMDPDTSERLLNVDTGKKGGATQV